MSYVDDRSLDQSAGNYGWRNIVVTRRVRKGGDGDEVMLRACEHDGK